MALHKALHPSDDLDILCVQKKKEDEETPDLKIV